MTHLAKKHRKSNKSKTSKSTLKLNLLDLFFIAVGIATSIIAIIVDHDHTITYIIASILALNCAIISTVLAIKGRRSNFIFAFINAVAFGFVSWSNQFYGSTAINLLFYAPCAIIGFYSWGKHSRKNREVIARKFTPLQAMMAIIIFVVSTITLNLILESIGGQSTILDSSANVLVIFASLLVVLRYREQWIFWLITDILQLLMWAATNDPTILVLRIFYPLSSIYGYINWRKLVKKTKK